MRETIAFANDATTALLIARGPSYTVCHRQLQDSHPTLRSAPNAIMALVKHIMLALHGARRLGVPLPIQRAPQPEPDHSDRLMML